MLMTTVEQPSGALGIYLTVASQWPGGLQTSMKRSLSNQFLLG
ncbi:hypothetical protein LINPERHAP1_LOCUS21896 [Linum perenne]